MPRAQIQSCARCHPSRPPQQQPDLASNPRIARRDQNKATPAADTTRLAACPCRLWAAHNNAPHKEMQPLARFMHWFPPKASVSRPSPQCACSGNRHHAGRHLSAMIEIMALDNRCCFDDDAPQVVQETWPMGGQARRTLLSQPKTEKTCDHTCLGPRPTDHSQRRGLFCATTDHRGNEHAHAGRTSAPGHGSRPTTCKPGSAALRAETAAQSRLPEG